MEQLQIVENSKKMLLSGVTLFNTLDGSIPSCVWTSMPNLTVLHMTGNGFTGKIGTEGMHLPVIENLSLAHNRLTGTLPTSLTTFPLSWCDVSYNRVTGNLPNGPLPATSMHNDSRFVSHVNRLSGHLPAFYPETFSSLRVVLGNLFDCGRIPSSDDEKSVYVCGSSDLDDAQFILIGVIGVVFIFMLLLLLLPVDAIGQISLLKRCRSIAEHHLFYIRYMTRPTDLSTAATVSIRRMRMFCVELHRIAVVVFLSCMVSLLFSCPLYALKVKDSMNEESLYLTHSVQYRWLYTAALLYGYIPALLLIITWTFVVLFIFYSMPRFAALSSLQWKGTKEVESGTYSSSDDIELRKVPVLPKKKMIGLFILNFVIVGTVNGFFIYSTYQSLSPATHVGLQVALALFKTVYNSLGVPKLAAPMKNIENNIYIRVCLSLFNQLLIPCIITALTSPSCFQGLLVEAKKFHTHYTYPQCYYYLTHLDGTVGCTAYVDVSSEVQPITPPFIYNYDCGSTLLRAYIPVYIYVYSWLFCKSCYFLPFWSSFEYDRLPHWVQKKVVGLIWPYIWCQTIKSTCSPSRTDAQSVLELKTPSAKRLLSFKSIASSDIFRHVAVLLTFGICSPVLGLLIAVVVALQLRCWVALLGRFAYCRTHLWHEHNSLKAGNDVSATIISCDSSQNDLTKKSPPIVNSQFNLQTKDLAFDCICDGIVPLSRLFDQCCLPILWSSAAFVGGIAWDMSSDEQGWLVGCWAPISCSLVSSVITNIEENFSI